jgi:hypothetical protein
MPQSRIALQKLLHIAEAELVEVEALLTSTSDAEASSRLIGRAVALREKIEEIKQLLGSENNSHQRTNGR